MPARRDVILPLVVVPAIAAVAWPLYGGGFVNFDAMWSLVWGDELASVRAPSFDAALAPTPHPLSNLVGVLLSPLGTDAETVLHLIGYLTVGALVYATGAVAYRLFGPVAAVIAGALVLTRNTLATYGALAYLDVAFAALVVGAVALEAARPRRGPPVLALLAVAGLLRPEAWFLAAGYWAWLARGDDRVAALRLLPLVAAAPLVWAAMDLIATGNPAYSFTHTRSAAEDFGRVVGVGGLVEHGPRVLGQELRPAVTVAALAGYALVLALARSPFLLAWTTAAGAAFALPVAAGTPLNARYLLPVIALACVAAAGALTGWTRATGRRRAAWQAAAVVMAVLLVVTAPAQARRLSDGREWLAGLGERRDGARAVLRPGLPCLPAATVDPQLTPFVVFWARVAVDDVRPPPARAPATGSFVWGTPAALEGVGRGQGATLPWPPADARVVRREGGWTVLARCAARP